MLLFLPVFLIVRVYALHRLFIDAGVLGLVIRFVFVSFLETDLFGWCAYSVAVTMAVRYVGFWSVDARREACC